MSSFMNPMVDGTPLPATTEQQAQPVRQDDPFLQIGDRVFKTKEDAINHFNSAQSHISKLEKDWEDATTLIDRQSELLDRARRVEELASAIEQNSSTKAEPTPHLKKEDIIAEAMNAFEQRQKEATVQETKKANWNAVTETLSKMYGEKTDEVVQKVIGENGISLEEAVNMASSYPKVFLKMFGGTQTTTSPRPHTSSVSTAVAGTAGAPPRKSILRMSTKEKAAEVQRRLAELQ